MNRRQYPKGTVRQAVKACVNGFRCTVHVSEVIARIRRFFPAMNEYSIRTALHNLVHKFKVLVSPMNQHYQRCSREI